MSEKSKGFCKYCGKEYTKGGMLRHLDTCKKREESFKEENKRSKQGYFQISISDKYDKDYWIIIEINEKATLRELDSFIRDIWVECCGHLSSFIVGNINYDIIPNDEFCSDDDFLASIFGRTQVKSMDYKLKDALEVGQKFKYEYDYGSTTELTLKVDRHRVGGKKLDNDVEILSRNNPPQFICQNCRKNKAKWITPEGISFDNNIFWCDECLENGEDIPEYVLPICNSPRMGVCAYEGSNIYPEQFEPDVVDDANKIKKVSNEELSKSEFVESEKNEYKVDAKGRRYKQILLEYVWSNITPKKRNYEKATIEQWRKLYEIATRIGQLKPWENIMTNHIIAVKREFSEDVLYYRIRGFMEMVKGIEMFEGEEAFNSLLGEYEYKKLNIPLDYVIYSQNKIACYWDDREDLKETQRKIIKELGYKYRGRGNWLNFVKDEPGFDFMTLNKEEVSSTIENFKILERALEVYEKSDKKFSLLLDEIFYVELKEDGSIGESRFKPLLIEDYVFEEIKIEDKKDIMLLEGINEHKGILELKIFVPNELYYDRTYNKYTISIAFVFGNNKKIEDEIYMSPSDNIIKSIADEFIHQIFSKRPKEVHVSNAILEVALREICRISGIKLKLKKELSIDKM